MLAINPDSGAQVGEFSLSKEWRHTDISSIRHGDTAQLNSPVIIKQLKRIDGIDFLRGSATLNTAIDLLGVKRTDLRLFKFNQKGQIDIGMNGGDLRLITVFSDDRFYQSGVSYLGAPIRTRLDEYLPYQLPVVDLETGHIKGTFGPTQIRLSPNPALDSVIARFNRQISEDDAVIFDTSLSGSTLAVLVANLDGPLKLHRLSPDGITEKLICTKRLLNSSRLSGQTGFDAPNDLSEDSGVRLNVFALKERDEQGKQQESRPVVIRYTRGDDVPQEAVLYFHGGPGGTLADEYWSPPVLKMLRANRDVIAVEYSGSIGGGIGLSRRLSTFGMRALKEDVDDLVAWLKREKYQRIIVIANSFGAVPAMLLVTDHPSVAEQSFFTAPFLKLLRPAEWVAKTGGVSAVAPDTQLAYEQAYFGGRAGRERFSRELTHLVVHVPFGPTSHFYFAQYDSISTPDQLPPNVKSPARVIRDAMHESMQIEREVWEDIQTHVR